MAAPNWNLTQVLNQLNSGDTWSGSQITYSFPATAANSNTGGGEGGGFQQLSALQIQFVKYSLACWDDLIAPNFVEGTGKTDIEVSNTTTGIDYAHAYFPNVGSVWFNPGFNDLTNPVIGEYGYGTIIHELGHALGLEHMGDYNGSGNWTPSSFQDTSVLSIMSYFGPDQGSDDGKNDVMWADWVKGGVTYAAQTPMLNDIYAIQTMYGVDTTTRTGDTVYGFNSNLTGTAAKFYDFDVNGNPILCLFDSSGTDTLDLSGFSTTCSISLVAGTFSDCNQMTNNISIAYSAVIENAVGGSASDTIVGNTADNVLTGGGGNDTIDGGGGDDIVVFAGAFASYTITQNGTGSYTVTDKAGTEGTDTLSSIETLRFSDRDFGGSTTAPTVAVAIEDQSADPDMPFAFIVPAGSFTDPNGDTLTYTATLQAGGGLPSWLSFNATTRSFSGTPDSGDVGILSIVVTASDGSETASDTFNLVIGDAGGSDIVGTTGNDPDLSGTAASENIFGLAGKDTISAGDGDDVIVGGAGLDALWGESGADTFAYNSVGESPWKNGKFDTIMDFSRAEGDRIDLSAIDANTGRNNHQDFKFVGKSSHLSDRGELDYWIEKGSTYIYGYTDADKNPEFFLVIDGAVNLKASDFIL
jgi:serralysin